MYFTAQRICTFIVGIAIVGMSVLFWVNGEGGFGSAASALLLCAIGVYVIVASLIPHRTTAEEIGNEVLWRVFIEIPLRVVARLFGKLSDIF